MLLPSSPPPSTLSAFVGLLKFVVGHLLSYWDPPIVDDRFEVGRWTEVRSSPGSCKHKIRTPYVVGQKRFLLGTDLKNTSTTTRLMTASSNKTPDVDSQSILPAATVSYTVHVPRRAEEVDEAMPSFENEEKRHVSDCFKSIKPSSPLSLCVNEITIFGNVDGSLHFVKISMSFASCMRTCSDSYMASTLNNATKKPTKIQ
ncbi:hypothetical protein DY000_02055359 [Brassica cretica]|uniref:Uncharacterized protein n=1 Tax=Brassica cretica TaxID=69181 RepID=A0ABQ7AMY3_BRACR|nr:hypothetical protein DY000_02055359 [Brassica cretica]